MRAFVCFLALAVTAFGAPADIAGSWILHLVAFGEETSPARVELKVDGDRVTGTLNELKLEGTLRGDVLKLRATRPNGDEFAVLEGRLSGTELRGTGRRGNDPLEWVARRVPAATSAAPQTRTFEPAEFHRYFSGTIAPALHINPGDTVRTNTVDAGGRDAKGVRRSNGGNPETGPFYVEGAMPGDTLVVKLDRIRLNRDSAESGDRITTDALGAGYIRDAKYDDHFNSDWKLDREGGTAMLAKPSEHLKDYRVKLQPMLGCVAVAPPDKQTFRSGWLGSYGGNMDYNSLREGVTLYLPVYQEGALLFVGDGHAAQGDGELTGDALETSMDVEFTVNLIRGQSTGGPRAENDEYLMAMGIANSLPDAIRQATTQLARWLERDYHLTPNESAVVLGTAIRYDIAELVDPQVNIVAKISKTALAGLAK
ncbi:MAG TPA: acetamidase/formamidase family protein [Verrucomicrobiae bacterium]|nr:acetamidase/formamidase family protein [Verrucomicrobiae bacterium]